MSDDRGGPIAASLMTVFLAVLKRPMIVIISVLVIMIPLIGFIISKEAVYQSSGKVMISISGTSFLDEVSAMGSYRFTDRKSPNYYMSILHSRTFMKAVTDRMIEKYPTLPEDSLRLTIVESVRFSNHPREPEFITIVGRSGYSKVALATAESAVEEFQKRCIELQRQDALGVAVFVEAQIKHITEDLGNAEKALQEFLSSRKLMIGSLEEGITGELNSLEKNLSEAEAKYAMVRSNVESYSAQMGKLVNNLTTEARTDGDSEIENLKTSLDLIRKELQDSAKNHLSESQVQALMHRMDIIRKQMVNMIASPVGDGFSVENLGITVQRLEGNLELALIEQTNYQNQILYYKAQVKRFKELHPNLPDDVLAYARLTRSKYVLQTTLEFMLAKRETARIRIASEQGGVKIIDAPAQPKHPLATGRSTKLILGLLTSIGLGIMISMLIDRSDNSVKEESDIRQKMGLTVFGTIPLLDQQRLTDYDLQDRSFAATVGDIGDSTRRKVRLLTEFSEKSPVAEAYRALKITLQFQAKDQNKKIFVITSPSAAEGKSLTTSNLGISFAHGGKRTLIIDGDLRRPDQHKNFSQDRKPGLTDHLLDEVPLKEIVRDSGVANLSLITAGSSPTNPAELLASNRMTGFLESIKDQFDIILIDSPPTLICADPVIIGEQADGVILIVKVESTTLTAVEHAVRNINRLDVDICGVILNQASFRFGLAYYYAYKYYRPYSYYGAYSYRYEYDESVTGKKSRIRKKAAQDRNRSI